MAKWYLTKIQFPTTDNNGKQIVETEEYLIDAVSFTDAETRLMHLIETTRKDFEVLTISPQKLADVFEYPQDEDGYWYKLKVEYIGLDDRSGKETHTVNVMLIAANSVRQALDRLDDELSTMLVPWEVTSLSKTAIFQVLRYQGKLPFRPLKDYDVTISDSRGNSVHIPAEAGT